MNECLTKYGIKILQPGCTFNESEVFFTFDHVGKQIKAELSGLDYKVVCLGNNCFVRRTLNWFGVKPLKADGELTHPFDLSAFELDKIIECLEDDFLHFCNPRYLKDGKNRIYGGSHPHEYEDYYENDAVKFRIRYLRRIANFYEDIYSGKHIFFVNANANIEPELSIYAEKMIRLLSNKFKNVKYNFIMANELLPNSPSCFDQKQNFYIYHPIPYSSYEWHMEKDLYTEMGLEHSLSFACKVKDIIIDKMKRQIS